MTRRRAAAAPSRFAKLMLPAACMLAFSLQSGIAPAAEESNLSGKLYLQDEKCGKGSAKCEVTLEISGEAARILYENMKSKAVADSCTEGFVKVDADALRCFLMPDKTYECDVGYSFAKKRIVGSSVTC